jgi:hypothetical protein
MATALLMGTGAAMAVEKAKDATTKEQNATKQSETEENAAKESDTEAAPETTSAKAASAAGSKIVKGFANETPIQIPFIGQASPYPSEIQVSGFPKGSRITDVDLLIFDFSHDFPRDVDILLVGPTGKKRVVMSDVGGDRPVNFVDFNIDDEASDRIPSDTLFVGSFKPTNLVRGDIFPSPASAPGRRTSLSGFDGTNPNGTWKLFVVDSAAGGKGAIQGGWEIGITAK